MNLLTKSDTAGHSLKRFTDFLDKLLRVPHAEIKAKLEEEKAEKRKKSKKSSASREEDNRA
jgi:hypothetical protein